MCLFGATIRSVHDLDLFSAGLAEYPLPGAAVGPTFTCIIGIQFYNLKYGDRFWFEHKNQIGSFTPGMLITIQYILYCNNNNTVHCIT